MEQVHKGAETDLIQSFEGIPYCSVNPVFVLTLTKCLTSQEKLNYALHSRAVYEGSKDSDSDILIHLVHIMQAGNQKLTKSKLHWSECEENMSVIFLLVQKLNLDLYKTQEGARKKLNIKRRNTFTQVLHKFEILHLTNIILLTNIS